MDTETTNSSNESTEQVVNCDDESASVLAVLSEWCDLAFDDSKNFIERFCPEAWMLTSVSWDSENMRFVYILDCGQHISDSVKIGEWLDFLLVNKNKGCTSCQ